MKKKHKEIPVPDPKKVEPEMFPSASWNDMTGLIPSGGEVFPENYDEVYDYLPEDYSRWEA